MPDGSLDDIDTQMAVVVWQHYQQQAHQQLASGVALVLLAAMAFWLERRRQRRAIGAA